MYNQPRLPDSFTPTTGRCRYVGCGWSKAPASPDPHRPLSSGVISGAAADGDGTTIEQIEERYHMAERFSCRRKLFSLMPELIMHQHT